MPEKNKVHDNKKAKNKERAYEICGAKKKNGKVCKQKAGWGTNHVGTGRCKLHGGCSTGPKNAKGNTNAVTHGLYKKYFPKETLEMFTGLEELSYIDILWANIKLQYGAIIQAQDNLKVINEDTGKSIVHPNFFAAQTKAMTTLSGMIKTYDDLLRSEKTTEEQELRILKLKAELDKVKIQNELLTKMDESGNVESIAELDLKDEDQKAIEDIYKVLYKSKNETHEDIITGNTNEMVEDEESKL